MRELTERQRDVLNFIRAFTGRHGVPPTVREIGDKFGVRYLLAGSLVRSDGRIRINVMMNDPPAGRTLWATEFDRPAESVIEAAEEIVNWVIERIGARRTN